MKFLKILGVIVLILILVGAGAITYVSYALPNVGEAPDLKVEMTPERVARGEYLATSVMGCLDCHARRDFSKFAGPVIPGTHGAGGEGWLRKDGFPGDMVSPNITPYALKNWTDGEIYRAITMGVNKDGKALFPIMPYNNYGQLADEDIHAVIAYLRTIPAVESVTPKRDLDFPLNLLVNTMPNKKEEKLKRPGPNNKLAYGKYMLTAAACNECHTPQEQGAPIAELYMAGGFEFPMPNGTMCRSSNLTPDKETGIGGWTAEQFLDRFNNYRHPGFKPYNVAEGEFNTMMPWQYYGRMNDEDLEAIFVYLQSLKPVNHRVEKFEERKIAEVEP